MKRKKADPNNLRQHPYSGHDYLHALPSPPCTVAHGSLPSRSTIISQYYPLKNKLGLMWGTSNTFLSLCTKKIEKGKKTKKKKVHLLCMFWRESSDAALWEPLVKIFLSLACGQQGLTISSGGIRWSCGSRGKRNSSAEGAAMRLRKRLRLMKTLLFKAGWEDNP